MYSDKNTVEDLAEPLDSNLSMSHPSVEKKEEISTVANINDRSRIPPEPCRCDAEDIKKAFSSFYEPDSPFIPINRSGEV